MYRNQIRKHFAFALGVVAVARELQPHGDSRFTNDDVVRVWPVRQATRDWRAEAARAQRWCALSITSYVAERRRESVAHAPVERVFFILRVVGGLVPVPLPFRRERLPFQLRDNLGTRKRHHHDHRRRGHGDEVDVQDPSASRPESSSNQGRQGDVAPTVGVV